MSMLRASASVVKLAAVVWCVAIVTAVSVVNSVPANTVGPAADSMVVADGHGWIGGPKP